MVWCPDDPGPQQVFSGTLEPQCSLRLVRFRMTTDILAEMNNNSGSLVVVGLEICTPAHPVGAGREVTR